MDSASVGSPPKKIEKETQTIRFVIYGLEERPEVGGEYIASPILRARGYLWEIRVYPKGHTETEGEHVGCFLYYAGSDKLSPAAVTFAIRCKQKIQVWNMKTFQKHTLGWGCNKFIHTSLVRNNYLERDGSLVIEADIWIATDSKRAWYPKELQRDET